MSQPQVYETPEKEKNPGSVTHFEHLKEKGDNAAELGRRPITDIDEGFDPAEVKHTLRRVDWRLIPILAAMYTVSALHRVLVLTIQVSAIDRANLSLARAANKVAMDKDLGLAGTNNRYSIITLAFFIPYIILEIP
jgi:hypothetical protein